MVTFNISSNCVTKFLARIDNKRKQMPLVTPALALPLAIDLEVGDLFNERKNYDLFQLRKIMA